MATDADEQLATRARAGDRGAFAALVERYTPRLLAFLTRACSVPAPDAEDVAQGVWLRVWRALPAWTATHFRGWLFAITRNAAADHRAARARRPADSLDALPVPPAARGAAVGGEAETADEVRRLRGCLDKLETGKPEFRSAFEGFAGGQTYEQLATAAGVPVGTVKSRIARAREWLQRCMGAGDG